MNAAGFGLSLTDWDVGEDYECISLLGTGSYGSVCFGKHIKSGKKVAIKQMKGIFYNEKDCKRILREIKILKRLDHPYIISLYDIIEPKDLDNFEDVYIVLELADSDLKKVLRSGLFLTPLHVKTILYNLLCALYYLHSAQVLHRDLKPANVLVDESWAVKLCDFGLARSIAPQTINEEFKQESNQENSQSLNKEIEAQSDKTPTTVVSNENKDNEDKNDNEASNQDNIQDHIDPELLAKPGTHVNGKEASESDWASNFEPKCDTPRLHFKKPKEKPKSLAGTKRKALNTNMGFSFGKGGIISQDKNDKKDEEGKDEVQDDQTQQRKRDKKDIAKSSKQLVQTPTKKRSIKSDLSVHVVTRWYRSPEIILLERDYGPPIDIWSVGCIFAELLTMLKENAKSQLERKPLFPGTSWYPLSPRSSQLKASKKDKHNTISKEDQLWVIIDKLGTPSEEDTAFISDKGALSYLQNLPKAEKKNFEELYPFPGEEALDLLNKMLQFNPYKRASLMECLEHPHLAEVRDTRKELKAKTPIILDFEYEDVNKEILRELFVDEILFFRRFYKRQCRSTTISSVEYKSMQSLNKT